MTNSSGTEMTTSSEVVLSMLLNSLPNGGTITRAACGSTMRRMVCRTSCPAIVAASIWPGSIEMMPARTISVM